jgi:hypothetical protein
MVKKSALTSKPTNDYEDVINHEEYEFRLSDVRGKYAFYKCSGYSNKLKCLSKLKYYYSDNSKSLTRPHSQNCKNHHNKKN